MFLAGFVLQRPAPQSAPQINTRWQLRTHGLLRWIASNLCTATQSNVRNSPWYLCDALRGNLVLGHFTTSQNRGIDQLGPNWHVSQWKQKATLDFTKQHLDLDHTDHGVIVQCLPATDFLTSLIHHAVGNYYLKYSWECFKQNIVHNMFLY